MAAANEDWYPRDAEGQVMFNENLAKNTTLLVEKYGASTETKNQVAANALWLRFWFDYRSAFDLQSEQLTAYYNAKALGKNADGDITKPIITPPVGAPPEIEGDVKTFVYALRREIVNKPNFSEADGELLGFIRPATGRTPDSDITARFKTRTLANYELAVEFTKQGTDALRLEFRRKGGNWQKADTLTANGSVRIEPTTPGQAEQIELRAILLRKNEPVGNYSDIQTALLAP